MIVALAVAVRPLIVAVSTRVWDPVSVLAVYLTDVPVRELSSPADSSASDHL